VKFFSLGKLNNFFSGIFWRFFQVSNIDSDNSKEKLFFPHLKRQNSAALFEHLKERNIVFKV